MQYGISIASIKASASFVSGTKSNSSNWLWLNGMVFYNNTYHQSISMKPSQVNTQNEFQVFRCLFPASQLRMKRGELQEGDHVRISRKKRMFEKEHAAT